jgi:hypothetical protein
MNDYKESELPTDQLQLAECADSLVLVKFPKNFDISFINGLKIKEFSATNCNHNLSSKHDGYVIDVNSDCGISSFRPLIQGNKSLVVGPSFRSSITMRRVISAPSPSLGNIKVNN